MIEAAGLRGRLASSFGVPADWRSASGVPAAGWPSSRQRSRTGRRCIWPTALPRASPGVAAPARRGSSPTSARRRPSAPSARERRATPWTWNPHIAAGSRAAHGVPFAAFRVMADPGGPEPASRRSSRDCDRMASRTSTPVLWRAWRAHPRQLPTLLRSAVGVRQDARCAPCHAGVDSLAPGGLGRSGFRPASVDVA